MNNERFELQIYRLVLKRRDNRRRYIRYSILCKGQEDFSTGGNKEDESARQSRWISYNIAALSQDLRNVEVASEYSAIEGCGGRC